MTAAPSLSADLPARLEHVVARNAVRLRRERSLTQLDLARAMSAVGMGWTPGRAQQVESFAGTLSMPEILGLCWALEVPLADLLAGDDHIALPGSARTFRLHQFRDALTGHGAIRQLDRRAENAAAVEEVRVKAAKLGLGTDVFIELCRQRFGHSFRTEREQRAGDLSKLSPRSAQVKRGHAARGVLSDLREHIATRAEQAQAPPVGDGDAASRQRPLPYPWRWR